MGQNLQMLEGACKSRSGSWGAAVPQLPADVLDDPFEPPPEKCFWMPMPHGMLSEVNSTDAGSQSAYSATPTSRAAGSGAFDFASQCASSCASGLATPTQFLQDQHMSPPVMPLWFPVMSLPIGTVDVSIIPRGIVQSARVQFERVAGMK